MTPKLSVFGGAAKLGFFVSCLTVASVGARLATADTAPGVEHRVRIQALADSLQGRGTDASLRRLFDPDSDPLFARFDPEAKRVPVFGAVHAFEGGPPVWRPLDLAAPNAQSVNAAVQLSLASNPPARPFVLTGSAADRANALTCLTQAVYYEAGFEPVSGQQAVAQVVLNRMRHPIFPHSVCSVVYQGASLKTGCQFSFTCDGSLKRKPQPAAWDRAKQVAARALSGFVMKDVGGATHYHTEWVVPWWQPTVSKVAQIGAHIFYRWQGALGLPAAFTMRYAGNERIVATPNPAAVTELAAAAKPGADGRVHAVIQLAANTPAAQPATDAPVALTPRQRMQALAARGALGQGFDPAAIAAGQAKTDTPTAPAHLETVTLAPVTAPAAR